MTGKQIYSQTKQFPLKLLLLGVACAGGALLWFLIWGGIGWAIKNPGIVYFGFMTAIIGYAISSNLVAKYIGYMFKYGAVYCVAKSYSTGMVSASYFDDSVGYIKNGFLKANAWFVIDRLVNKAVRGVTRLVNFVLGFLPKDVKRFVDTFINIYLNYVDECCLGYSMIHEGESVVKGSCDGVVLYFQNAKGLLKPALKTSIRVVLTKGIIYLVAFLIICSSPIVGYIVGMTFALVADAVVTPYLNHRVLCDTMVAYLEYATTHEVQADLYGTLMKVNPFKKLYNKQADPEFANATA